DDERIRAACSFILKKAWHRDSGGFSQRGGPNGGQGSGVIPCLAGNMLWVLIRFGYLDDPRVQSSIEWFCHYQRFDDGDGLAPTGWPYDNWEICWGRHSCHMGVVKMLKAFSEIPENMRSEPVSEAIARGAEFMLIHHIFKRSHKLERVSKPGWKKFGFPLMYQTDALEILNILLDLGYRDPRMNEAAELVRSKQGEDGCWLLENSYNQSLLVPIERKDASSKWVTLNALRALKRSSFSTEAVA
ncbi:MAG: nitrogen fixation protein NifH, partial [Alphaproteobacteria bacterium]